ncbi:coatomer WD associated region-domain-containing protein [Mycena vulgaris]|nr:coatomer WD associated region-domain-containing protein [Mycena vulgaris]
MPQNRRCLFTLHGHFENVSTALFHPKHELSVSCGDDKTVRVWDLAKRTAIQTFRRENDRFWVLSAHPNLNLFAAGHNSEFIVFKLKRERPAFAFGSPYVPPRTLSFNPAERTVLVTISSDNGLYELTAVPQQAQGEVRDCGVDGKKGAGQSTISWQGTGSRFCKRLRSLIHETIRIKSSAWDDSGAFIYSTLNHVKYCLSQGDHGVICTLDNPVYLIRVKGKTVHCLDRSARPRTITLDPTEYRFKLTLLKNNYEEMLYIILTSTLLGQSIITYLQQKGFPEALKQGIHKIVEKAHGCKVLNMGGGVATVLTQDTMTCGPTIDFSIAEATAMAGRTLFVRFTTATGDAMGMKMGTKKALELMQIEFPEMVVLALSGDYCTPGSLSSNDEAKQAGLSPRFQLTTADCYILSRRAESHWEGTADLQLV